MENINCLDKATDALCSPHMLYPWKLGGMYSNLLCHTLLFFNISLDRSKVLSCSSNGTFSVSLILS